MKKDERYKTLGCKMPLWVFDYIKKKGLTQSEYVRKVVFDNIRQSGDFLLKSVNAHVNDEKNKDETLDIHEKVDRILDRYNWD